jgi:hypothetical protein
LGQAHSAHIINFKGKINERVKGDFISFVFSTMGNFFDQFFFFFDRDKGAQPKLTNDIVTPEQINK